MLTTELLSGGIMMMDYNERALEKLGTFEISAEMQKLAHKNEHGSTFLNDGRGNPNWIETTARLAFSRLIQFGTTDASRTLANDDLVGYIESNGVYQRLVHFLKPKEHVEDQFLLAVIKYCHHEYQLDSDQIVAEWVNGVLGNDYPSPDRCLTITEIIPNHYLQSIGYRGSNQGLYRH
jgi:aspartate 4-decarboxylase